MNDYKKNLKFFIKNKYREAVYHNKNFLNEFFNYRSQFEKKIKKQSFDLNESTKKDLTYFNLKNCFEKKTINQNEIEIFYKKFEFNFQLKEKYDKRYFSLSKNETSLKTYIYLGHLILKLKRIDIFQKLNIILKILDKLSINEEKYKYYNYLLTKNLIKKERDIIKKILNR